MDRGSANDDNNVTFAFLCRIFVVGVLFFTILFPISVYVLGNNLQFLQAGGATSNSNSPYNNADAQPVSFAAWQQQYFLQHAQCRSCLRHAAKTPVSTAYEPSPDIAYYLQHPTMEWVWCAADVDTSNNSDKGASGQPHDRFGKCTEVYDASQPPCGVGYHPVTNASQCSNDPSWSKPTCSSCVLDAYVWCRGIDREDVQRVIEHRVHDETQGFCVDVTIDQLNERLQASNATTISSPIPTSCIFRDTEVTALEQCHNPFFDTASSLITPPSTATLENLFAGGGSSNYQPSATGQPITGGRLPFSFFVMPILAAAFVMVRVYISRREESGTWTSGTVEGDGANTAAQNLYSTAVPSGVYATDPSAARSTEAVELSPLPRASAADDHHPIVIDEQHGAPTSNEGNGHSSGDQRQHRHYDRLVND